jgi:uncharacterized membrane protein HdeD (DUF308 family)
MEYSIVRNWWALVLRGILAILFGFLATLWPGAVWLLVVASFAAFSLLDGVLAIVMAVSGHGQGISQNCPCDPAASAVGWRKVRTQMRQNVRARLVA